MSSDQKDQAYIRNGVAAWSAERQCQVLTESGFDGPIYQDELTHEQLRGRNVAALRQRAEMLQPASWVAPGRILVANIRILALSPVDLATTLAAAAACQATVRALDTGLEIKPDAGVREVADAVASWDAARRDDQTRDARIKGGAIATQRKEQRREEALSIARPLWALPSEEMSAEAIADRAGLSVRTLYAYLGRRMPAQRLAKRKDHGDE